MSGASGAGCRFLSGSVVLSVQPEFVGIVSMGSFGTDVFDTNFRAVFDDMNQRHRVPPTQSVVCFEPVDDEPRLDGWRIEATFVGKGNKLSGRQGSLFFDRVEVGLK